MASAGWLEDPIIEAPLIVADAPSSSGTALVLAVAAHVAIPFIAD